MIQTKTSKPKKRSQPAKKLNASKKVAHKASPTSKPKEQDSVYFLKLVIYLVLGSQWLYIQHKLSWVFPIPVGVIIGLLFAQHEHFLIDRKIEYMVLVLAAFISYWLPLGLVIDI